MLFIKDFKISKNSGYDKVDFAYLLTLLEHQINQNYLHLKLLETVLT